METPSHQVFFNSVSLASGLGGEAENIKGRKNNENILSVGIVENPCTKIHCTKLFFLKTPHDIQN